MKNLILILCVWLISSACKKEQPDQINKSGAPPGATSLTSCEQSLLGIWYQSKRVGYVMSGTTPLATDSTFYNNPAYKIEFTAIPDTFKAGMMFPGYKCINSAGFPCNQTWTAGNDTLRSYGVMQTKGIVTVSGNLLLVEDRSLYPSSFGKYYFHR